MSSTEPDLFEQAFEAAYAQLCEEIGIGADPVETEWMKPVAWAVVAAWRGEDDNQAVLDLGPRFRSLDREPTPVEKVHAKLLADRFFVSLEQQILAVEGALIDDGELPANLDYAIAEVLVANDILGRPLKAVAKNPSATVRFEKI